MKKIKVLQIIGSSNIGGAEKVVYSLLKYMDRSRFEVSIACPEAGGMFSKFKKYASDAKVLGFKSWMSPFAVLKLKRYIKEDRFDIVHTHLYSADFIGLISARLSNVPCRISTIHGYNFSNKGRFGLRSIKNFFFSFVYRLIYIFSDRVVAISEAVRKDLTARPGIKVNRRKIDLIYDGIDLDETLQPKGISNSSIKETYGPDFKFAGVIANFDKVKGHGVLLKAIPEILKQVGHVKFLFAGEGKEKRHLDNMAEKLKIRENTAFLGMHEDIASILKLCDVVVLPSLSEGLSLVILEAMALGKPIVATRVGGIPELIKDNENGLLVKPDNQRELALAIIRILKDESLAAGLGDRGRGVFYAEGNSKFSAHHMTRETERLYERCLRGEN